MGRGGSGPRMGLVQGSPRYSGLVCYIVTVLVSSFSTESERVAVSQPFAPFSGGLHAVFFCSASPCRVGSHFLWMRLKRQH